MGKKKATVIRKGEARRMELDWGVIEWLASGEDDTADELTLGYVVIEPGQANPEHSHPNCEEALHVVSGEIEHTVEGEPNVRMKDGDTIGRVKIEHQHDKVDKKSQFLVKGFGKVGDDIVALSEGQEVKVKYDLVQER